MATITSTERQTLFQKILLSRFGLDRDNSIVFWITLIFAGLLLGSLYLTEGNVPLVLFIIYITGIFLLSILRLDFSLYLFMACVMFLDQYEIPYFATATEQLGFFSNIKEIQYIPFFDAGMTSPAELHLLFLLISTMMYAVLQVNLVLKPIPVFISYLAFLGVLIFSMLYGLSKGGDLMVSLWEVRALFYLCLLYIMVPQIINTRSQIYILVGIFIAGTIFKALQGVIRFIRLGFTTGGYSVLTNHEDAVFIVTIILLLLGFMIYHYRGIYRYLILFAMPILLLGFYVAQRRATYASLIVSILVLIILLPGFKRIDFLKYFSPILLLLVIYTAMFWNSDSRIGRPVQFFKSGIGRPDPTVNVSDYYSNLYRIFENYNLAYTISRQPVMGTGFGREYDQPIPLVQIRFTLQDYIPHNQILWVIVKMGFVGFVIFWYFFNMVVANSTRLLMRVKDPFFKALLLMITLSVINQMVVSFFDLQLTYYRNMLYLGCLIALVPSIEYIFSMEDDAPPRSNGTEREANEERN